MEMSFRYFYSVSISTTYYILMRGLSSGDTETPAPYTVPLGDRAQTDAIGISHTSLVPAALPQAEKTPRLAAPPHRYSYKEKLRKIEMDGKEIRHQKV
jgi:hypothetical protein